MTELFDVAVEPCRAVTGRTIPGLCVLRQVSLFSCTERNVHHSTDKEVVAREYIVVP